MALSAGIEATENRMNHPLLFKENGERDTAWADGDVLGFPC